VRASNRYRTYSDSDIERLRFIRAARALGCSLNDLRDILTLRDRGDRPCQEVMRLLQVRLGDLDAQIEQLRSLRGELHALIQAAEALSAQPKLQETCGCDLLGDRWAKGPTGAAS
jgi:DNA-binding transcriptional MerR regulator